MPSVLPNRWNIEIEFDPKTMTACFTDREDFSWIKDICPELADIIISNSLRDARGVMMQLEAPGEVYVEGNEIVMEVCHVPIASAFGVMIAEFAMLPIVVFSRLSMLRATPEDEIRMWCEKVKKEKKDVDLGKP